tara:strand:+ start:8733 stop:9293 length:561 start_codon:yes stop_codon:yes gene_type:complete
MWFKIIKSMGRYSAQKYLDNLTKKILDELEKIYGKDAKLVEGFSGQVYMSKEYTLNIAWFTLDDIVNGEFGGDDTFKSEMMASGAEWYKIDIKEDEWKKLGEEYLFNLPSSSIWIYFLGQYGDPPHIEIHTHEPNSQVAQFVDKEQKKIIERFKVLEPNINPAMHLTPEQEEEMEESENWRKNLEE